MAPPAKTNAAEVHDSLSSRSAESEPNSPQHYGLVPDLPSESGQGGSPEIAVSNSRGSERRQKPVGKLREAALEEEGQQCSGNEEVIHLLALRCLIDEVCSSSLAHSVKMLTFHRCEVYSVARSPGQT